MFDKQIELLMTDLRDQCQKAPLVDMSKQFNFVLSLFEIIAGEMRACDREVTASDVQVQFHLFLSYHLITSNQEERVEETLSRLKQWVNKPAMSLPLPN